MSWLLPCLLLWSCKHPGFPSRFLFSNPSIWFARENQHRVVGFAPRPSPPLSLCSPSHSVFLSHTSPSLCASRHIREMLRTGLVVRSFRPMQVARMSSFDFGLVSTFSAPLCSPQSPPMPRPCHFCALLGILSLAPLLLLSHPAFLAALSLLICIPMPRSFSCSCLQEARPVKKPKALTIPAHRYGVEIMYDPVFNKVLFTKTRRRGGNPEAPM